MVDTLVADKRGTMEAIGQLLSLREPPTAIFAEQDEVAVSVIWTLRQSNVEVPERMSVVGFDDHQMAEWSDLTTMAQSPRTSGAPQPIWPSPSSTSRTRTRRGTSYCPPG